MITRTLPLTSTQVRALIDGLFFLQHGGAILSAIDLQPYCRQCVAVGLPAAVVVTSDEQLSTFRCAHTSGFVKRRPGLEVQPLLMALNWGLRCPRCQADATGANSAADQTLEVGCDCTIRLMVNPISQTAGPHQADGLGR